MAYLCGIKPIRVFRVLIVVTFVESWWRAKWLCSNCDGRGGEFERWERSSFNLFL